MKVLSRIVALVVAVALVVGALAVRDSRDGDRFVADDGGGDDGQAAATVVCPADLSTLCDAVADALPDVTVDRRPTAATASEAATGAIAEAWLVPASWADVTDDARSRATGGPEPLVRSAPVAISPVRVLGVRSRVGALAELCGGSLETLEQLELSCLAELVDEPWPAPPGESGWGRVGVAFLPPETSTGLDATAAVAASVAGVDFGARELDERATSEVLRRFAESVAGDERAGPFGLAGRLRSQGPSFASFVVDVEAELGPDEGESGAATGGEGLVGFPARPILVAELVVVGDEEAVVERVADALTSEAGVAALGEQAGWRTGPATVTPDGRPDGPSLTALRIAWSDIAG